MGLSTDDALRLLDITRCAPSTGTLAERLHEVGTEFKRILAAPYVSFFTFDRRAVCPTREGLVVAPHERSRVLHELVSTGSANLMDEALLSEYVAGVLPFDRYARALILSPGRPQRLTRCFTSAELRRARHVYVARHLRPADIGVTLGVHLPLTEDLWLAFSFARGRRERDFSPHADRVLQLVTSEVAAIALGAVLDEAARRPVAQEALPACGLLVFGAGGTLLQASPGALKLAASADEPDARGATAIALAAQRFASSIERTARLTFLTAGEGCLQASLSRMPGTREPDKILALLEGVPPDTRAHLHALMDRAGLTPRERAVAELTCRGLGVREVAREVGVSPTTVKSHLRQVYSKTGASSQAELAALLLRADGPRLPSHLDRRLAPGAAARRSMLASPSIRSSRQAP